MIIITFLKYVEMYFFVSKKVHFDILIEKVRNMSKCTFFARKVTFRHISKYVEMYPTQFCLTFSTTPFRFLSVISQTSSFSWQVFVFPSVWQAATESAWQVKQSRLKAEDTTKNKSFIFKLGQKGLSYLPKMPF